MTDGEGMTTYVYNSFRQLQSETRTFTGLANNNYTLTYTYNLAGQVTRTGYGAAIVSAGGFNTSNWGTWNPNYDLHLGDVNGGGGADLVGRNAQVGEVPVP